MVTCAPMNPEFPSAPPSRIRVLPPGVAERIAAGEVVERPSSVVKELVENSLDAGATEVAVMLGAGGKALIEIVDNGRGMDREDLSLCARRHATSKLTGLDDLDRISTLGFRGEALPSIGAVADLSIVSRAQGREDAHELKVGQPGATEDTIEAMTFGHFLGSPHGTRIRAQGLFAQIPARLKFLKAQASEVSQVRDWLERLALTHPHVGFRLMSEDRTVMQLRPQSEVERVRAVLADGEDFPVETGTAEREGIRVRVHWLQGLSTGQARKLVQVVNHRAVKDRMLQQAILSPFRQTLLPGQYPAVALFIEVDPSQIDVNVHPTKSEIRFLDSGRAFRAVGQALEALIAAKGAPGFAPGTHRELARTPLGFAGTFGRNPLSNDSDVDLAPTGAYAGASFDALQPTAHSRSGSLFSRQGVPWTARESGLQNDGTSSVSNESSTPATWNSLSPVAGGTYAGTLFNTYLLYDLGSELGLIDQHAAHERIRYEKLKNRVLARETVSSQSLLSGESINFPAELRTQVETRLTWLAQMGFEAEIFGESSVLFRAIPAEWGTSDLRTRLKNLVERLLAEDSNNDHPLLDESLFEKLASEACHSAVRAGDRLEPEEVEALASDLFECEHPWNCPHGRPTFVRVPRARFEEWFQRRV